MSNLRLILVDPNRELCAAWTKRFAGLPGVEIVHGRFEKLAEYDCLVSPANSFGLMDGGIDGLIVEYFGHDLMVRVQRKIIDEYLGEQPIGTCMIVETNHARHPYLAHSPTMRLPMEITSTDHAYLSLWAVLTEVRRFNRGHADTIRTVACPGLGCGTGRMPYEETARQMSLAYRYFLDPPKRISWEMATARQASIGRGGDNPLPSAR